MCEIKYVITFYVKMFGTVYDGILCECVKWSADVMSLSVYVWIKACIWYHSVSDDVK